MKEGVGQGRVGGATMTILEGVMGRMVGDTGERAEVAIVSCAVDRDKASMAIP